MLRGDELGNFERLGGVVEASSAVVVALQRNRFRRYLTVGEAEQYVAGLASHADLVPDPLDAPSVTGDPDDDYLIARPASRALTPLSSATPIPSASTIHTR